MVSVNCTVYWLGCLTPRRKVQLQSPQSSLSTHPRRRVESRSWWWLVIEGCWISCLPSLCWQRPPSHWAGCPTTWVPTTRTWTCRWRKPNLNRPRWLCSNAMQSNVTHLTRMVYYHVKRYGDAFGKHFIGLAVWNDEDWWSLFFLCLCFYKYQNIWCHFLGRQMKEHK